MPTPLAPRIIVSQIARTELNTFVRAHSTPHALGLRARLVLQAADVEQPTNLTISRQVGCDNRTGGKWRRRYAAQGLPGLQDAVRSGRPKTMTAPTRVHVISVASTLPQAQECTVTRWTVDAIAATVLHALHTEAISRSSIFRILLAADLQPHKSAYWLNSHDEDFDAKAPMICPLDATALASYQQGRMVICCAEKTGMQILERKAPTKPATSGRRERREHAYIRHGTRVLIKALAVATGQRAWTSGPTRTTRDVVAHLRQAFGK